MSEETQAEPNDAAGAVLGAETAEGAMVAAPTSARGLAAYLSPARWRARVARYRARRRLARSKLFDAAWYGETYPETAAVGALSHYASHGFREGRYPNPLFDARWYLRSYDDVRESGVDPLLHYVNGGEGEGRRPNLFFDPLWYRAHHPEVAASGLSPLLHYIRQGAKAGLATSEAFDGAIYLAVNPDLKGVGDPLAHYLHQGWGQGRPTGVADLDPALFDSHAYIGANPDLHQVISDAFSHYITRGRSEGRARRPSDGYRGEVVRPGFSYTAPRTAGGPGVYSLSQAAAGYCYLPPRPPADLKAQQAAMGTQARFSIVTPVYNVDPAYLDLLVRSVEAQWHGDWELILVDDASPRAETRRYLETLRDSSLQDPRIKVALRARNGGIAEATNSALAMAKGDYVVFLDHDDELTEDCLYELARRIAATDADFIYSDEDKIDEAGNFFMPFFKPDWSPDAFMSIMYTCHVSCVRRALLEEVGGVRTGFDGAQDYDLIFRVTEKARRIEHIAKVLYHWRTLPTSVAADINAKPGAITAAVKVKIDALVRRGLVGKVEDVPEMPGQFRVSYTPNPSNKVSIIIPTKDNRSLLEVCVESIRARTDFENYEIVVIDNGSRNGDVIDYLNGLSADERITVLSDDRPFNFSALNNRAVDSARGDYLLFLNDDTEVRTPDWLGRMLGYAQLDHVGAVGAKLLYPGGGIQHCGITNSGQGPNHSFLFSDKNDPQYFGRKVLEYDWIAVTAACMMVSKAKFNRIGGFDEAFPVAYNDIDLCFRLFKSGLYNVVCQKAELTHFESASRGADKDPARQKRLKADWRRLYDKHPDLYMHDPFYSSNLDPYEIQFNAYAV